MANLPRKPQAGDRTLQSMYDAICNIIDYLPSLEIRGDNRTIRINSYGKGKTIEAVQYTTSIPNSGGGAVEPESPIPAVVSERNGFERLHRYFICKWVRSRSNRNCKSIFNTR